MGETTEYESMWKAQAFWKSLQRPFQAKAPGHRAVPSILLRGTISGPSNYKTTHSFCIPISSTLKIFFLANTASHGQSGEQGLGGNHEAVQTNSIK